MTDYQWSNDMGKFRELLDEGVDVICMGIGKMVYQCARNTDGRYLIYGTTYEKWTDVEKSDVGLYLKFLPTIHEPTASDILSFLEETERVYAFAIGSVHFKDGGLWRVSMSQHSGEDYAYHAIHGCLTDHFAKNIFDSSKAFRALMKWKSEGYPELELTHIELADTHTPIYGTDSSDVDEDDLPF